MIDLRITGAIPFYYRHVGEQLGGGSVLKDAINRNPHETIVTEAILLIMSQDNKKRELLEKEMLELHSRIADPRTSKEAGEIRKRELWKKDVEWHKLATDRFRRDDDKAA